MTQNEVEWVIDELASVVDAQPNAHPLRRINRDIPHAYDGGSVADKTTPDFTAEVDPEAANTVGVASADRDTSYAGSDPDLRVEQTVSVRVRGQTALGGSFGHIDPTGNDGVAFTGAGGLVEQIKSALHDALRYPDTGRPTTQYCDLKLENESNLSRAYRDEYRYTFDVRFTGFEEL